MRSLEERIRPHPAGDPRLRDVTGALLVIAVTGILVWVRPVGGERHFTDVAGEMFSFYLLPGLGFVLALRCGAIDLSVWSLAALGGAVAVSVFRLGGGPATAILAGAGAGASIGAIHGLLVGRFHLPTPIVTIVTGSAVAMALRAIFQAGALEVPDGAFDGWVRLTTLWPSALRMSLVAGLYLLVMCILGLIFLVIPFKRRPPSRTVTLLASLCASGALGSVGGVIWVVDQSSTPIPRWFVGDLRIPAAAVLAGAAFFTGRGRTLLAGLCLPATVLAGTMWRLGVIDLPLGGYSLQMLLLIGMTVVVHLGISHAISEGGGGLDLPAVCPALTAGGMLLLAAVGAFSTHAARRALHLTGLGAWTIGAALLLASHLLTRRLPAAHLETNDTPETHQTPSQPSQ